MFLTSWATPHEFFYVSIHVWPEESTLPNFCMGTEGSVVSSIRWGVTMLQNLVGLTYWWQNKLSAQTLNSYGSSQRWNRLRCINFFLSSSRGIYPVTMKFTKFAYHGLDEVTFRRVSSLKQSFIGRFDTCTCILERWSTTQLSAPFLSLISKSNSWRSTIQRMSRCLASFLVKRYFSAAWSIYTITFALTK